MTPFETYLIFQATAIAKGFFALALFTVIGNAVFCVNGWAAPQVGWSKTATFLMAPVTALFLIAAILAPTTQTLVAVYSIPAITNSEQAKQLSSKSLRAIDKLLSQYLEEK